jgi:hypothetical protein
MDISGVAASFQPMRQDCQALVAALHPIQIKEVSVFKFQSFAFKNNPPPPEQYGEDCLKMPIVKKKWGMESGPDNRHGAIR